MKHLKKFEELRTDAYVQAGEKLIKLGHRERGQKMIDWAKRGQLEDTSELNLWIKWMNTYPPGRGSQGVNKGIISDVPIKAKIQSIQIDLDTLIDDVEYNKQSNYFPVLMSVSFSIHESELEKIKPEYLEYFKSDATKSGQVYKIWPLVFNTGFTLNSNGNIDKIYQMAHLTYGEIGSMFSDRKSANNFKTILKKVLSNDIKVYTGYKDDDTGNWMTNSEAMIEILTREIPTFELSDVETLIDAFKDISTNFLYNDNPAEALARIQN
jgi:hypothetical protein